MSKFIEGMRKASQEFKKLPKEEQERLSRAVDELQERYRTEQRTCRHCGQAIISHCYSCYG